MATIITPRFRASYPSVFEAKLNALSKKEEYSVVALFPKGADLSKLKAEAESVAIEKWGANKNKWPRNLRSPFRDQAEKAKENDSGNLVLPDGHEAGAIFMNLKSYQRPQVVNQNVEPIIDRQEFYAGCWAVASVRAYAYEQMGNAGISFGLNNIQKVADATPLGGGNAKAEDEFAPIAGTDENQGSAGSIFS